MAANTAALATRSPEAAATKPLEATSASPNPSTDVPNAKNVTSPGELCGYVSWLRVLAPDGRGGGAGRQDAVECDVTTCWFLRLLARWAENEAPSGPLPSPRSH